MPLQDLDFVTIICQRKDEKKITDAALKAGAPGVTSLHGQGTGVRQKMGVMGSVVEAEKAILLLALPPGVTPAVVKAVNDAGGLNRPGGGLICLQKAQQVLGYL